MSDRRVRVTLTADTTAYWLPLMADALMADAPDEDERRMAIVLRAAAVAWQAGDRGPLVLAVVDLADQMLTEILAAAPQRFHELGGDR